MWHFVLTTNSGFPVQCTLSIENGSVCITSEGTEIWKDGANKLAVTRTDGSSFRIGSTSQEFALTGEPHDLDSFLEALLVINQSLPFLIFSCSNCAARNTNANNVKQHFCVVCHASTTRLENKQKNPEVLERQIQSVANEVVQLAKLRDQNLTTIKNYRLQHRAPLDLTINSLEDELKFWNIHKESLQQELKRLHEISLREFIPLSPYAPPNQLIVQLAPSRAPEPTSSVLSKPIPQEPNAQNEEVEKKDTTGFAVWKVLLLFIFGLLAFAGVVVGIVFLSSIRSANALISGGLVSLFGGIGILAIIEFLLQKRKKTYDGLFDLCVGVAFFIIQGSIFALIARGASVWSVFGQVIATFILAIFFRIYLKNHRSSSIDPRFLHGGPLSWGVAVFSTLAVSWVGFPLFPYFGTSRVWVMVAEIAILSIAFLLALQSDRGYLVVISTLVLAITPVVWTGVTGYSLYGTMYLLLAFLVAVLSMFSRIRPVWMQISSSLILLVGLAFQIECVVMKLHMNLFDIDGASWNEGLSNAIWLCSLTFLPAAVRHRAPLAPLFWCLGIAFTNFPAMGAFWPVLAVCLVIFIYTFGMGIHGGLGTHSELGESSPILGKPEHAYQLEISHRVLLRIAEICLWVGLFTQTYLQPQSKWFIPLAFGISLFLDARQSSVNLTVPVIRLKLKTHRLKSAYDGDYPIPFTRSMMWSVAFFLVFTAFSPIVMESWEDASIGTCILFGVQVLMVGASKYIAAKQDKLNQNQLELGDLSLKSVAKLQLDQKMLHMAFGVTSLVFATRFLIECEDYVTYPYFIGVIIVYLLSWNQFKEGKIHTSIMQAMVLLGMASITNAVLKSSSVLQLLPLFVTSGLLILHIILCRKQMTFQQYYRLISMATVLIGIPTRIAIDSHLTLKIIFESFLFAMQLTCSAESLFSTSLAVKVPASELQVDASSPVPSQYLVFIVLSASGLLDTYYGVCLALGAALGLFKLANEHNHYFPMFKKAALVLVCLPVSIGFITDISLGKHYWSAFIGSVLLSISLYQSIPAIIARFSDTKQVSENQELVKEPKFNSDLEEILGQFLKIIWHNPSFLTVVTTSELIASIALLFVSQAWSGFLEPFPAIYAGLVIVLAVILSTVLNNIVYVTLFPLTFFSALIALGKAHEGVAKENMEELSWIIPLSVSLVLFLLSLFARKSEVLQKTIFGRDIRSNILIREMMWLFCLVWAAVGTSLAAAIVQFALLAFTLGRAVIQKRNLLFVLAFLYLIRFYANCSVCSGSWLNHSQFTGIALLVCSFGIWIGAISNRTPLKISPKGTHIFESCLYLMQVLMFFVGMWLIGPITHGILPLVLFTVVTAVSTLRGKFKLYIWVYPFFVIPCFSLIISSDWKWSFLIASAISAFLSACSTMIWKYSATPVSEEHQHNFQDFMAISSVVLSFFGPYASGSAMILFGFFFCIWRKWLLPAIFIPGLMGLSWSLIFFYMDVPDLSCAIAFSVACGSMMFIVYFIPARFWVISEEDKKNSSKPISYFILYWNPSTISRAKLIQEEQAVFWLMLSTLIASYFQFDESATSDIVRGAIFPISMLLCGTTQAVAGFLKSPFTWRENIRLQGMLLMSIAVVSGAIISFLGHSPIIGGILLIFAGCMIIAVIILQLYWWNVFQKWLSPPTDAPNPAEPDPLMRNSNDA